MGKKLNLDKPVQTRDGRPARILATDRLTPGIFKLIALITTSTGIEQCEAYTVEGKFYDDDLEESRDLVNVPEVKVFYANAYKHSGIPYVNLGTKLYSTEDEARSDASISGAYIGPARVEITI